MPATVSQSPARTRPGLLARSDPLGIGDRRGRHPAGRRAGGVGLTVTDDSATVEWTVTWTEEAGECVNAGVESFSGSEVTVADESGFSIRGRRSSGLGPESTCELGGGGSSSSSVHRFEVDGSTVTGDIGLGIATIEVD